MEYVVVLIMLLVVILLLRWTFGGRGRERTEPLTAPERRQLIDPVRSRIEVMLEGGQRGRAVQLVRETTGLSLRLAAAEVDRVRSDL